MDVQLVKLGKYQKNLNFEFCPLQTSLRKRTVRQHCAEPPLAIGYIEVTAKISYVDLW
ncbi:hypothetical protein ES706_00932 [subsurface metagenome]